MPAIEILRLFPQQKIAHGRGPAMQAGADLVERRTLRRAVADEHQRRESHEAFELLRQFRLAVFAGRVEGRWIGISDLIWSSAVPCGGQWQMSTSGASPTKPSSFCASSASLYSPGVWKGVGLEYPDRT